MRIGLAFRVWWGILRDGDLADSVSRLLESQPKEREKLPAAEGGREPALAEPEVRRSDAVALLAALQREARFVDMIKEPLGNYTDAQIGAAARDVLRGCGEVVDRMFGLEPLVDGPEGASWEVPPGYDAGCYRLTGNVEGRPPFRGRLVHHGWKATRCELPRWTGKPSSASVVAPAEVEVASADTGSGGNR